MQPFEQFLLLWLSQRKDKHVSPSVAFDDESDRRAAYKGLTPEILTALEAALAEWRDTLDLDKYEANVRDAISPLPRRRRAVRRLMEPLRCAQTDQVDSELFWMRRHLSDEHKTRT